MRRACYDRAGRKCRVGAEVGDFESSALGDGERVEGEIEIQGLIFGAEIMGEPPALLVTGTDEGDGGLGERASELGDVVEMRFETFDWNGLAL